MTPPDTPTWGVSAPRHKENRVELRDGDCASIPRERPPRLRLHTSRPRLAAMRPSDDLAAVESRAAARRVNPLGRIGAAFFLQDPSDQHYKR